MQAEVPEKKLNLIVAVARGGAIGRDNGLLWHISDDLKRFKALTMGGTVVMGRKTYLSFPKRPLPGRFHIVLTTQGVEPDPNVKCAGSVKEALAAIPDDREAFVIGGGKVYAQLLPYCTRAYLTEVDAAFPDADTFFPALNPEEWRVEDGGAWQLDEKSGLKYRYVTYVRL